MDLQPAPGAVHCEIFRDRSGCVRPQGERDTWPRLQKVAFVSWRGSKSGTGTAELLFRRAENDAIRGLCSRRRKRAHVQEFKQGSSARSESCALTGVLPGGDQWERELYTWKRLGRVGGLGGLVTGRH